MNLKDYVNYSVIVKTEDGKDEILRTVVDEKIKGEDVIAIKCNADVFKTIDRVLVVFYDKEDAVQYKGTVRRVHFSKDRIEIALHHGEEYKNRNQKRFEISTGIELLRKMDLDGNITQLEALKAELLDISNSGAGFRTATVLLAKGDLCAFMIENKALKRVLFAKVVRKTEEENDLSTYGCVLLTEEEVRNAGFFKDVKGDPAGTGESEHNAAMQNTEAL